jgi:hypothetical protein
MIDGSLAGRQNVILGQLTRLLGKIRFGGLTLLETTPEPAQLIKTWKSVRRVISHSHSHNQLTLKCRFEENSPTTRIGIKLSLGVNLPQHL